MSDLLLPANEQLHPGQSAPVLPNEHPDSAACTLPYNLFYSVSASRLYSKDWGLDLVGPHLQLALLQLLLNLWGGDLGF